MNCRSLLELFISVLIRSAFAGWCGAVNPKQQTVPKGTTVSFFLIPQQPPYIHVQWRYELPTKAAILCDSKDKQCKEPNKYTQSRNGQSLTIEAVFQNDSGTYICRCYTETYENWSKRGTLNVTGEKPSAGKDQVYRKKSSTESTTRSTTHSTTATIESKTVNTKATDSATNNKVSSTLEDTGQVTTIVVAGGVVVGALLTVIVVVKICKKGRKDDIHLAGQKSGMTQTNSEGAEGQDNSLLNDSDQPHSRQLSDGVTSFEQHEAKHNPDTLYDQQTSSSAAEQFNSEYATVVPKKDRISSIQQWETNKVVVKEEESPSEYATVANSRQTSCSVEQTTQGGKDKNAQGLVYVDLDLVSRPRREAASRAHEATEYVSIDFQKTATLKLQ